MFKIESYVTPILLSYVDKYVRDFKPADAQVSLWGGGVALHNLVLKADVLQQELLLPFTLISGRIHELLIQVPWTKIMSEPIVITIDTIECVLSLRAPAQPEEAPSSETSQRRAQVVEAPPGYMQALVRRVVSNISLRVHHLIVKYVEDDIVLSLNVKHLAIDSADALWNPSFADIDQSVPVLRRLMRLDDLTLCLDRSDSDGKIRIYQEPVLYRCQLHLRVLTKLASASTRRAVGLSVHIRSSRLAWGLTGDQLALLMRLLRERTTANGKLFPLTHTPPAAVAALIAQGSPSNTAEPVRSESWSEWAWSWLPAWSDREEGSPEDNPMPHTPNPMHFTACLDSVSLVFKVTEVESGGRRKTRSILELCADYAAIKGLLCHPTTVQVCFGARSVQLRSNGRCVCGHVDLNTMAEEPTVYLSKLEASESEWAWPPEAYAEHDIDGCVATDDDYVGTEVPLEQANSTQTGDPEDLWKKLAPVVFVNFYHERSPPSTYTNPYENPPDDFEYSDWVESCTMKIRIQPIDVQVCTGLMHRLSAIRSILQELPTTPAPEITKRTLTVEECDALCDNLPQKSIEITCSGVRVRLIPWDHSLSERPTPPKVALHLNTQITNVIVTAPLYPIRVCAAACQLPRESGPLWQGCRVHVTGSLTSLQATLAPLAPLGSQTARPVARADMHIVSHKLLHSELFTSRESVEFSYTVKFKEINVCGSAARLQAACQVVHSLLQQGPSFTLRNTTLVQDAICDEESVAVDVNLEDFSVRGFITRHINTHIAVLQSARATVLHKTNEEEPTQAWLFSGPDAPTASPYFRLATQWCSEPMATSLDYFGFWSEPTAVCIDPLFIAWLAYTPQLKHVPEPSQNLPRTISSTQYLRRRYTPPSSSGRGLTRPSSAELVHSSRPRSQASSSEPSEKKEKTPPTVTKPSPPWWEGDGLLDFHARLRKLLFSVELGLVVLYVTMNTASAVDCATVRDAMERHAAATQRVIAFSFGRFTLSCSAVMKFLWQEIRHDGPTFLSTKLPNDEDSFPWKLKLSDMSCYTLEVRAGTDTSGREKAATGLRSQLKIQCVVTPRTVIELVTTTLTLSVVTKTAHKKTHKKHDQKTQTASTAVDVSTKYFTAGQDFKPTTLKEFVRGPARRKKEDEGGGNKEEPKETEDKTQGPVVSLGVHLHADTPPIIVRLDHEQVHIVGAALHCFAHLLTLLRRKPPVPQRHAFTSAFSQRSLKRSVSEVDEIGPSPSDGTVSEHPSEALVSIFESKTAVDDKLKTFLWFQWVISRATLVIATDLVKLVFNVDDIISTVDLQEHYNQLKVKVASASVRHYERVGVDEWTAAVMGGRVLEAREPTNPRDDNHFLAITITQARISNLPASWKEELHPKILQSKNQITDTMWEIYATLAPLESVLRPAILENTMCVISEMMPRSYCTLPEEPKTAVKWQWPFLYIVAGGLRLLVYSDDLDENKDDTFMFVIGKVEVNPHPENPICRRAISAPDTGLGWATVAGGHEGRQYEVFVRNVAIHSAQFKQIVNQEVSDTTIHQGTSGENPALKWTQPPISPVITPVLHPLEISCVYAPPMYTSGVLMCGPAFEFNLASDCSIELSMEQLRLTNDLSVAFLKAFFESQQSVQIFANDTLGACPYSELLKPRPSVMDEGADTTSLNSEEALRLAPLPNNSVGPDSGVDTVTSVSHFAHSLPKKNVSIAFLEDTDAADHMEVFITVGMIELSLYMMDDGDAKAVALRAPEMPLPRSPTRTQIFDVEAQKSDHKEGSVGKRSKSVTEANRTADVGKTSLRSSSPHARKAAGMLPLVHVTLHQPNLYYYKKKSQRNFQASLFNAWVGLGADKSDHNWHLALFSTAKGLPDPVTDIPPALATLKLVAPYTGSTSMLSLSQRGKVRLDVERPIELHLCSDRCRRLELISKMIAETLHKPPTRKLEKVSDQPPLYTLRNFMVGQAIESITIQTTQIGVTGSKCAIGWADASLQIAAGIRPERLVARAFVNAFLVSLGSPDDDRHPLLHPMIMGMEVEALWEAWRRAEHGLFSREPTVRIALEMDRVVVDARPDDLITADELMKTVSQLMGKNERAQSATKKTPDEIKPSSSSMLGFEKRFSGEPETSEHYYKDDLRSGAFKIVTGGQLPMAYQINLHGCSVSWRYPHPRAITRIVAFPLPNQDEEVDCVLEHYNAMLSRWEPHSYFKLPANEPRELRLHSKPPDMLFAVIWRCRTCVAVKEKFPSFVFRTKRFMPRSDPLMSEQPEEDVCHKRGDVTAEQLSGVLRVDSYFAPRLLPRLRCSFRLASIEAYAHNSLPSLSSQATALEGFYLSKPLIKSHRVLDLIAQDTLIHANVSSIAGTTVLITSEFSSEVLDCGTGAMDRMLEPLRAQFALSLVRSPPRARFRTSPLKLALNVPVLRTLLALRADWNTAIEKCSLTASSSRSKRKNERELPKRIVAVEAATALDGRVSLWIHNSCAFALRMGQEGTDEIVPLGPGARVAYRWRSPSSPKKLRFTLNNPSDEWYWSNSVPFKPGSYRVRLQRAEALGARDAPGSGVFAHIQVDESCARRHMRISGRLCLANMMRHNLLYKVRALCNDSKNWRTVSSGELIPESVGRTVLCAANCEMSLKLKFANHETGWSGDIPLKECPKENVPWLVKIPSEGDLPYVSVWCRVVRARSDCRVLASIWPLYVLRSHLPLDTDVLITTDATQPPQKTSTEARPPPLIQTALGRGASTHLYPPGTTSAKHSLTFQYRNIDCPVTREAVPLHYGVTDASVFEKKVVVNNIDDVLHDTMQWLETFGAHAEPTWPYSIVAGHWHGEWKPALMQPRCDVTVRYQAVRVGGGCCLEMQLCPKMLLCNASSIALTLRAHDATPLCKLEPGAAISPSSALLEKPFFISIEVGRETFVSGQLAVWHSEPGRYGAPPPGQVARDRPARLAIHCGQKVALLTLYYEIKMEINVFGVSCSYVLINKLETDLLIAALVVPNDVEPTAPYVPKAYTVIPPAKEGSNLGHPLCRFNIFNRWRGCDVDELRPLLWLALPASLPLPAAAAPVPLRLGGTMTRRAVSLLDHNGNSLPVVVTQILHQCRWLLVVAQDPCPQFVLRNGSAAPLAVAQCTQADETNAKTKVVPECDGAAWHTIVQPGAAVHYSTPAHCARYPLAADSPPPEQLPFLTFALADVTGEYEWCAPVAAAAGEQLLQLRDTTIKLRVTPHPHSTLLETKDVDQNDISASDIRKRLIGSFNQDQSSQFNADIEKVQLERTNAEENLITKADSESDTTLKSSLKHTESDKTLTSTEKTGDAETRERIVRISAHSSVKIDESAYRASTATLPLADNISYDNISLTYGDLPEHDQNTSDWSSSESDRGVLAGLAICLSSSSDTKPLISVHADRVACRHTVDAKGASTTIAIAELQVDNLLYDTGLYDFSVVASTCTEPPACEPFPPIWSMFADEQLFATKEENAKLLVKARCDRWEVANETFNELTELELRLGPLSLYIEDAYVSALVALMRSSLPPRDQSEAAILLAEARAIQCPLRLRSLHIQPLDLTLTLHTAVRMYIALDQSPLLLGAFQLTDMMTSTERLTHALTVHYLSAALLGAGWVVGGLELLGAPGALAARVGGAGGGVRGVATAAAAAVLRSLSACAGSLARNLDLLAGDEEHARRAAAARRSPPQSLLAGLAAGITNFAINILGAVGGLAHHPLVGVAVGEASGAAALRRGLLGALTKPLSATADLVAYAGHGLLQQTGWDPMPQPRGQCANPALDSGWRRDCVRWAFRLSELGAIDGFRVLLDEAPLQLILTHKFLVVLDPETERVIEMIDFKACTLAPYHGNVIELRVMKSRPSKAEPRPEEDEDEFQVSAAAMARVARYTGAATSTGERATRTVKLLTAPAQARALHASLSALIQHNAPTHLKLM